MKLTAVSPIYNSFELHHCFPGLFAPDQDYITITHSLQITINCVGGGTGYVACNAVSGANI